MNKNILRRIGEQIPVYSNLARMAGPVSALRIIGHRLAGRGKVIGVTLAGADIDVRLGTPDLHIAMSSLADEFEPLRRILPGDFDGLIVDAGGYIGTAAIRFAQMYPKARVVTIEPAGGNFELLSRNTHRFENIYPVNAALVAENRSDLTLFSRDIHCGYTIVETPADKAAPEALESISAVTLGEIREQHDGREIGILKLDIEGGEHELFKSGGAALDDVHAVFVELHDRIVDGCTSAFLAFSQGREVTNFGGEKFLSLRGEQPAPHQKLRSQSG